MEDHEIQKAIWRNDIKVEFLQKLDEILKKAIPEDKITITIETTLTKTI